jgi:hypothetical protein
LFCRGPTGYGNRRITGATGGVLIESRFIRFQIKGSLMEVLALIVTVQVAVPGRPGPAGEGRVAGQGREVHRGPGV